MPYIPKKDRIEIWGRKPITPGELNFAVTTICNSYLQNKGLVYDYINDVIGVLEAVKLELYRRVAVPYEDKKMKMNGDVYDKHGLA